MNHTKHELYQFKRQNTFSSVTESITPCSPSTWPKNRAWSRNASQLPRSFQGGAARIPSTYPNFRAASSTYPKSSTTHRARSAEHKAQSTKHIVARFTLVLKVSQLSAKVRCAGHPINHQRQNQGGHTNGRFRIFERT